MAEDHGGGEFEGAEFAMLPVVDLRGRELRERWKRSVYIEGES